MNEWRSTEKKPELFDLVYILHSTEKVHPGWWTGHQWDARRDVNQETVIAWKPMNTPRNKTA